MKRIGLIILVGIMICTGCGNNKDIVNTLKKKIEGTNNYHVAGTLEIINNENIYTYDVDVSYKKNDNFRVSLKNKTNEHEQIILKNDSGVFVLTPSLNKSFKFQSEWPYNNSQSYLLQNILDDILEDEKKQVEEKDDKYIITTSVKYSNNKELVKQKIYTKKDGTIEKVEVLNDKDIVKIRMTYNKIDYKANFEKKYFDLTENMSSNTKTSVTMQEIEDIIYPMYMPENTYLSNEEKVNLENGERIILTFAGDTPFTIIEETAAIDNGNTTSVHGEVELLTDVIGYLSDGVASWISNGIEYYAVSEAMDSEELLKVVNSISVIPVGK